MNKRFTRILATSIAAAALMGSLAACGKGSASATSEDGNEITMWTHNAGNPDELAAIKSIVDKYNKSGAAKAQIKVQAFPQDSYNDSVVSAAAAGKLPCIVDIDGPNVPNWAWAKYLTPLKLSTDLSKNLPSTVAKWEGETYAVGYYDVALAMLARASDLKAAGVRAATVEKPWTKEEFQDALTKLKALGKWQYPLDMGTAGTGEWLPYALLAAAAVLRRRPRQPRRIPVGGRCPQRRQGRRVGRVVPRTRRPGLHGQEERQGLHPGLPEQQERPRLHRLVGRGQGAQGARQGPGGHAARGPRQRTEDRRRLVAVGRDQRLQELRGRDGLPLLLAEAGKHRRRGQGHRNHPGHR